MSETPAKPRAQTQRQRWVKYGLNVALASAIVIALAVVLVIIAQRRAARIDTTAARVYSLKPQTLNILSDVQGRIRIVALYTEADGHGQPNVFRQPVVDLIQEYRRKGRNVEVEAIDPVKNPSRVNALIDEVATRYGGEVRQYQEVVDKFRKVAGEFDEFAREQMQKIATLPLDAMPADDSRLPSRSAVTTVRHLPDEINSLVERVDRRLNLKPPDYKGAVTSIESTMERLGRISSRVAEIFEQSRNNDAIPEGVRAYMADAIDEYRNVHELAKSVVDKAGELGELKLDDLRQSLRASEAILVMGENDMRVLSFDQVWQVDQNEIRHHSVGQEIKPRFAGEQQVTGAILALAQERKLKVAFVRFGGPPLTPQGFPPFQPGGAMSEVAELLRSYNFEILERDLSGMWAFQAQMSGMPGPPDATDEELADAIWVVPMFQMGGRGPMSMPPTFGRVAEHLREGGSALLLFAPATDNFDEALHEWGIQVDTNVVAAHAPVKVPEGRQLDMWEDALRIPFVFDLRDYGDHLITRPLRSLPGAVVPLLHVRARGAEGVEVHPILPVPDLPSWGETNLDDLNVGRAQFEPDKGDIPGPLFGGAVAERKDGGRLVVIGSPVFGFDSLISEPDPDMLSRGLLVARFPANAELFLNSVLWLAELDPMIAISPSAMQVSRIQIEDAPLRGWRVGLLVGLPGLVVIAGIMVYLARRD